MSDDTRGVVLSTVTPTARGEATRLRLAGGLSTQDVDRLTALLDDVAGPGAVVVVDLSRAESLPLGLLRALAAGHRRLRDAAASLVIADPSSAAARVLRVSGLHRVLQVEGWPEPPAVESGGAAAEPA